jgi:dTDP-4-amino-4,6-dideoxygalactose transaminase
MVDRNKLIRLSKSTVSETDIRAVKGVLEREFLGMGKEVQEFEGLLTEFFGHPTVCVVNGTAALHLACQAIGVGIGDEVLIQSLTYVATFQAISATGARPVACDVSRDTLTLDCEDAERRLTSRTKAVMPVHYSGGVGELDEIYSFANRYGLRVIEDAAHAFGTEYKGKRVGGFGDISCFSFDGIKNITSGEGGCIVTEDEEVLEKTRDSRLLGVSKDTEQRFLAKRSWEFDVNFQGWRYHMSNIMAAIGKSQLGRFPEIANKRRSLAKLYDILLKNHSKIQTMPLDYNYIVPHNYVVRIEGLRDRALLRKRLLDRNIETGIHYQPNHWLSLYCVEGHGEFIVTDQEHKKLLSLPLHLDLEESDVHLVVNTLIQELDR